MDALDGHWDHKTTANQFVYFVFKPFISNSVKFIICFYTALWSELGEGVRFVVEKSFFFSVFIDRNNETNENWWDFFTKIGFSVVLWFLEQNVLTIKIAWNFIGSSNTILFRKLPFFWIFLKVSCK